MLVISSGQDSRLPLQLQDTEAHQSDPRGLLREFSGSAGGTGQLYHQGPGDDSGQVLLQCPDGGRDGVVRQGGQRLQRSALQAPEEE